MKSFARVVVAGIPLLVATLSACDSAVVAPAAASASVTPAVRPDQTGNLERRALKLGSKRHRKTYLLSGNTVTTPEGKNITVTTEHAQRLRKLADMGERIDREIALMNAVWKRRGLADVDDVVDSRPSESDAVVSRLSASGMDEFTQAAAVVDYPFTCNQLSLAIYDLTVEYRGLQREIEAKEEAVLDCASRSFDCGSGGVVLISMSLELDWDLMVLESLAGSYRSQNC